MDSCEVLKIKKRLVWICGKKYEILGKWDTKELPYNFTGNHYYADKFFTNSEGNTSNGEARIHMERDAEKFMDFFGIDNDCNFFILKKDLEEFLVQAENFFKNPNKEDIKFDNGNIDEKFEEIKLELLSTFNNSFDELNSYSNEICYLTMFCLDDGSRFYLRNEDRSNKFYKLLRRICIPKKSYISFLKLKDFNGEIVYYMRLSFDGRFSPEKFENKLNDFQIEKDIVKQLCASLNAGHNIVLNGVPGTGKTHLATIFAEKAKGEDNYILTTATSDWTTFDTIGGLMPDEKGELIFHEGKFLQAIRENKWLIIDEINRADIDKAFGQLFTVLSGQNVELPYEIKNNPVKIIINDNLNVNQYIDGVYYIGKNWRIIATMNSYDKNTLFDLSYAFMRRFMFIEIEVPKSFDFINKLKNEDGSILDGLDVKYYDKLKKLFEINSSENITRKLGPAIFLDIFIYINNVSKLEGHSFDYDSKILADGIISFIIPQFEGYKNIGDVESFFEKEIFNEDEDKEGLKLVKSKLNDFNVK